MRRALNLLPEEARDRRVAFDQGLRAAGYQVVEALPNPEPGDAVLTWNRKQRDEPLVGRLEAAGVRVFVIENGYLGKRWCGGGWYALAEGHHAGAGRWPDGGPERWDALNARLEPWREGGTEVVVLGQRGIGEPGIRSPRNWAEDMARYLGGRVRPHPGKFPPTVTLGEDLANAACVVTWASSAALIALMHGIPVFYAMPKWIGAPASRPVSEFGEAPLRDDAARLAMFRRLAWAMWRLDEIRSGEAFLAHD